MIELDRIELTKPVEASPGRWLPLGAAGTVLHVYPSGAYEVEFTRPFSAVVTVECGAISPPSISTRPHQFSIPRVGEPRWCYWCRKTDEEIGLDPRWHTPFQGILNPCDVSGGR